MPARANEEVFIAMSKALNFIDPQDLSMQCSKRKHPIGKHQEVPSDNEWPETPDQTGSCTITYSFLVRMSWDVVMWLV